MQATFKILKQTDIEIYNALITIGQEIGFAANSVSVGQNVHPAQLQYNASKQDDKDKL